MRRLAAVTGGRVVVLGPAQSPLPAGDVPEAVHAADADAVDDGTLQGAVVVLTGGAADWSALQPARLVVAADLSPARSSLDTIEQMQAAAADAGWTVAHSGLVHGHDASARQRLEGALVIACRADDELAGQLAVGPLSLALDPLAAGLPTRRAARVLIASYEITGPTGNGGIGTAYHSLAHVLAAAGNDVTVLFTGWLDPQRAEDEPQWRSRFAEAGISFELLGTPWDTPVRSPHHAVRRAYELHRWLLDAHRERPFDVVHLPETLGHGAFAQTAKAMGLAYRDVEFVIGTHSSTRWVAECNREPIENVDLLVTEQLERTSVARADAVLSPSAYLVEYMRDRAWGLPERTFVQPYARPQSVRQMAERSAREPGATPLRELVFFGRLETRKGLETFCDAVDLLVADGACPFDRISLLGRPERVLGEDSTTYVTRRADAWGIDWQILPDLGHDEAVAYLRERPCVVAIPSLVDNSPNTVYEAVALGVPFVASRSGGTAEIIAANDLATSTFDGWHDASALEPPTFSAPEDRFDAAALAAALRAKAIDGASAVAAAVGDAACDGAYDRWHRAMAARSDSLREQAVTPAPSGLSAAVCIVDADGRDLDRISTALTGAARPPQHIAALVPADLQGVPDGVEAVRASGRDAGPARRALVERLDADVLIVLRGADDPDADLVERVCAAFDATGADVISLVCRDDDHERDTGTARNLRNPDASPDLRAFVPVRGPAIAALFYPALSVGPYAIRRQALARLGGYAADTWGETSDHELLARAALEGLAIEVHPDPLATTLRDDRWTETRARFIDAVPLPLPEGEVEIRRLRPFRRRLETPLADLPALLVGALRRVGGDTELVRRHYEDRRELVDAYEARLKEHRDLIELYEQQKEELRAALQAAAAASNGAAQPAVRGRLQRGLARATRGPVRDWPGRGARFASWRVEQMRRKLR